MAEIKNLGPVPSYLELHADKVIISLAVPVELGGVRRDKIVMRTPSLKDIELADLQEPDDSKREYDKLVFSSLTEVPEADWGNLSLKDWGRVQAAYFRLIGED